MHSKYCLTLLCCKIYLIWPQSALKKRVKVVMFLHVSSLLRSCYSMILKVLRSVRSVVTFRFEKIINTNFKGLWNASR